jgi:hypothetical protein
MIHGGVNNTFPTRMSTKVSVPALFHLLQLRLDLLLDVRVVI